MDREECNQPYLVGGLEPWNFMTFHSVGKVVTPTDFHIFQRARAQPPSSESIDLCV